MNSSVTNLKDIPKNVLVNIRERSVFKAGNQIKEVANELTNHLHDLIRTYHSLF